MTEKFTPIIVDHRLNDLYKIIFPTVKNINGTFGDQAKWYGLLVDQNTLIAFCTIGVVDDTTIFLYNVGVDPSHRRKGYGKRLIEHMINLYKGHDIYLFVNKNDQGTIQFYRECQFVYVARAYVPPIGEICMKRKRI